MTKKALNTKTKTKTLPTRAQKLAPKKEIKTKPKPINKHKSTKTQDKAPAKESSKATGSLENKRTGIKNETKEQQQAELKTLISRGKDQGYLTFAEVNDHLPPEIIDPEQIDDIIGMLNEDMGIPIYEDIPGAETLLLNETRSGSQADEEITEAAATIISTDEEIGRTTDPVRMYMREMGCVELLTRGGEITIAKKN